MASNPNNDMFESDDHSSPESLSEDLDFVEVEEDAEIRRGTDTIDVGRFGWAISKSRLDKKKKIKTI